MKNGKPVESQEQVYNNLEGNKEVSITLSNGGTETVTVSQLSIGKWRQALTVADDEMKITALICGKHESWIDGLTPKSYEDIRTAAREVNEEGFFAFSRRQNEVLASKINSLNPDALRMITESVTGAAKPSTGSQPGLRPR